MVKNDDSHAENERAEIAAAEAREAERRAAVDKANKAQSESRRKAWNAKRKDGKS